MNIIKRVALLVDFAANTLRGGLPTEPISAWVWRKQYKTAIKVIDTLFFWDKDHCKTIYERVRDKANLPQEYRDA